MRSAPSALEWSAGGGSMGHWEGQAGNAEEGHQVGMDLGRTGWECRRTPGGNGLGMNVALNHPNSQR